MATTLLNSSVKISNEDTFDLGICKECGRGYEAFCTICSVLVCPTCVMFGNHKAHNVIPIEEAVQEMRQVLDNVAKEGLLRVDKTEKVLLEIRQTKLDCEEKKQQLLKEADQLFQDLIKTIKNRRVEVLNEIEQHFEQQSKKIEENEQKWIEKQDFSVGLINFARSNNDTYVLRNSPYIMSSIQNLRTPLHDQKAEVVMDMNTNFTGNDKHGYQLSAAELIQALKKYVKKGDTRIIPYRC